MLVAIVGLKSNATIVAVVVVVVQHMSIAQQARAVATAAIAFRLAMLLWRRMSRPCRTKLVYARSELNDQLVAAMRTLLHYRPTPWLFVRVRCERVIVLLVLLLSVL